MCFCFFTHGSHAIFFMTWSSSGVTPGPGPDHAAWIALRGKVLEAMAHLKTWWCSIRTIGYNRYYWKILGESSLEYNGISWFQRDPSRPPAVRCSSAMRACTMALQWGQALSLLQDAKIHEERLIFWWKRMVSRRFQSKTWVHRHSMCCYQLMACLRFPPMDRYDDGEDGWTKIVFEHVWNMGQLK